MRVNAWFVCLLNACFRYVVDGPVIIAVHVRLANEKWSSNFLITFYVRKLRALFVMCVCREYVINESFSLQYRKIRPQSMRVSKRKSSSHRVHIRSKDGLKENIDVENWDKIKRSTNQAITIIVKFVYTSWYIVSHWLLLTSAHTRAYFHFWYLCDTHECSSSVYWWRHGETHKSPRDHI